MEEKYQPEFSKQQKEIIDETHRLSIELFARKFSSLNDRRKIYFYLI